MGECLFSLEGGGREAVGRVDGRVSEWVCVCVDCREDGLVGEGWWLGVLRKTVGRMGFCFRSNKWMGGWIG